MDPPTKPARKLSAREAKFVEAFAGNGTEAARAAGYKGDANTLAVQAGRMLRKAHIAAAIEARTAKATSKLIATREQRQEFWTEAMNEPGHELRDRLKASELLGKSEADFTEKHEHDVPQGVSITINRTVRK